jgi:hypothetical protein
MALAVSLMLQAEGRRVPRRMWIPRRRILATLPPKQLRTPPMAPPKQPKKNSHATCHTVSKTGHSLEKGASKADDQGEISKLSYAIHRFGAQVGRQFDPSAAYGRGGAVRNTCPTCGGEGLSIAKLVGFYEYHVVERLVAHIAKMQPSQSSCHHHRFVF